MNTKAGDDLGNMRIKKPSKRILYSLGKRNYQKLADFGSGLDRGRKGEHAVRHVLQRLIKKGLVAKNELGDYHLTIEGKKVVEKIVKEIDGYKSW